MAEMVEKKSSIAPEAVCDLLQHQDWLSQLVQSRDEQADNALAVILRYFSECVLNLPAEGLEERIDSLLGQLWELFNDVIGQIPANVILIPEIFHVLCAFAANGQWGPNPIFEYLDLILKHQYWLSQSVQSKDEQAADALAVILRYFSECIPNLPAEEHVGQLVNTMGALFGHITGLDEESDVSAQLTQGQVNVAYEVLNVWSLLLAAFPLEGAESKLEEFIKKKGGPYYFSCREDVWWRILHTSENPEVLKVLAQTHLTFALLRAMEIAGDCVVLSTRFSVGACDSCLGAAVRGMDRVIVIAEMQQRRPNGGKNTPDNMPIRLKSYAKQAEGS
jgi:hypothetical protein